MNQTTLFTKLEKGLRLLSGLALALMLFQGLGVLTYVVRAWPLIQHVPSTEITVLVIVAVMAGLARSSLWVLSYWNAAKVLSTLRAHGDSIELSLKLRPILGTLTHLQVECCILDVLLLPAIFLMDVFFPFKLSSVQLGLVQVATLLFPQAFGTAALILAYLVHQYGKLVQERCQMRSDLELIV